MPIKVIAFDADDTLWVNEPFFREAEEKFASLLEDFMPQHAIMKELYRTEIENLRLYGYGIKGFMLSMVETALRISDHKMPITVIDKIIRIGQEMLEKPVELLPGVEEVLRDLNGDYRIVMATKGRFEMAHGGTLFLDEIGDISASFQAKLLRVLQEREFERVGGGTPVKVDVRLILATNRDLERMVKAGEFRADLYYRINVVSIQLPPLRERREDIPAMAKHFLDRFNRENARTTQFSPAAMRVLSSCYWPGNVRELENCVERTATMAHSDVITDLAFPCQGNRCLTQVLHHIDREDAVRPSRLTEIPIQERPMGPAGADTALPTPPEVSPEPVAVAAPTAVADGKPEGESERLVWAMERSGWVQAKAARLLKISPRQMGYALQKHGIEVRKF